MPYGLIFLQCVADTIDDPYGEGGRARESGYTFGLAATFPTWCGHRGTGVCLCPTI